VLLKLAKMLGNEREKKPILHYPRSVQNAGCRVKKQILISEN